MSADAFLANSPLANSPLANSLEARDRRAVFHPHTNLALHEKQGAFVIARGKGIYLYDASGKEYIDGMAGLWCVSLGYGEPELIEAAAKQMEVLSYGQLFGSRSHEPAIALAEKLLEVSPYKTGKVFFGNSGSDANDTQIKLYRYYNNAIGRPRRKTFLSRRDAYHGVTLASASLTGTAAHHALFDLPDSQTIHLRAPHYQRDHREGESEEEFSRQLAAELEETIQQRGAETIAAMIAEPVMGVAGVLVPPEGYFPLIQQVLDRYQIPLISDEVICGFGRTGAYWGAETFAMTPFSLSAAKGLSSAYMPISAVIVPDALYEPIRDASGETGLFGHGFTYSGHPVACAVALRVLQLYEERKVFAHVRDIIPHFAARLNALKSHHLVENIRTTGLLGALDIKAGQAPALAQACRDNGLAMRPLGNTMPLAPPLIITRRQIDDLFDRLAAALTRTAAKA